MKRSLVLSLSLALSVASLAAQGQPAQTAPPAQAPASQAQLGPNTWQIDPAHSAAGFSVRHMMVSTVRGTLGPITGTVDYDGKSVESVKADVSIDVRAINTGVQNRDNDLRSPNFFDVATYPTVTFKSRRAEPAGEGKFKLVGDLTMHGVTKEVVLDVEGPATVVKQGNGGLSTGATATTRLNRKDFGLNWNKMIEAGPVVSDEVQVTIDLELRKRPPTSQ